MKPARLPWRIHRSAMVLALLASCAPPVVPPVPAGRDDPLAPRTAGATLMEVRSLVARPRLTLITRDGDPAPVVVVSFATGLDAVANAALAGVLAQRLATPTDSDGAGIRITWSPAPEDFGPALDRLLAAMREPVRAGDPALRRAAANVAALARRPLDAPALAPLAACSAAPRALARAARLSARQPEVALEAWRAAALVAERASIAVVGPRAAGEAVAEALADAPDWPRGVTAPDAAPRDEQHGAFVASDLESGELRLHVALRLGSAVDASALVAELASGSALDVKLRALPDPWRVDSARATALPHGGCVSLVLRPRAAIAASRHAESAAEALVEIRRDVAQSLDDGTRDAFVVTREIIGATSAEETAARAAWWLLSVPNQRPPLVMSALAVGADPTPAGPDDAALDGPWRDVALASAESHGSVATRVVSVERGQGQLWVLIANPCALRDEGHWDGGVSALTATAAAAAGRADDVDISPWVSASGAGIIAHGVMLEANEAPHDLARRVGRAAGRAFAQLRLDADAFALAQRGVLASFGDDRGAVFAAFAERAAPERPSWLAPWGAPRQQAAISREQVLARWRELVAGPIRVAAIANVDEAQATLAAAETERWLRRRGQGRCAETSLSPANTGAHHFQGDDERVRGAMVGARIGSDAGDEALAELTVAHLAVLGWSAKIVGDGPARALVLPLTGADVQERRVAAEKLLATLAPDDAAYARAVALAERTRLRTRSDARERLVRLWQERVDAPFADHAAWRAWLSARLGASQLISVSPVSRSDLP